jgi:hypothetical protein
MITTLDPSVVIAALEQEVVAQSAAIKSALVLIVQMVGKIQALEAQIAADQAALATAVTLTTSVQTDNKSLADEIAKYSASGQLSV